MLVRAGAATEAISCGIARSEPPDLVAPCALHREAPRAIFRRPRQKAALMDLVTRLLTWRNGEFVGTDADGNRYFQERKPRGGARRRRWVVYQGTPDASKVPPEWHSWLHYTTDAPLTPIDRPWIKPHRPNLTGTARAWRPSGSQLAAGKRAPATGDYEPWTPG